MAIEAAWIGNSSKTNSSKVLRFVVVVVVVIAVVGSTFEVKQTESSSTGFLLTLNALFTMEPVSTLVGCNPSKRFSVRTEQTHPYVWALWIYAERSLTLAIKLDNFGISSCVPHHLTAYLPLQVWIVSTPTPTPRLRCKLIHSIILLPLLRMVVVS